MAKTLKNGINYIETGKLVLFGAGLLILYKILKGTGIIKTGQEAAAQNLNENVDFFKWSQPNFYNQQPPANKVRVLKTQSAADSIALLIYESYDAFDDDEEQMQGALKQLTYKEQYSQIAARFFALYAEDLTRFLKAHFSESELFPVWQHIENLPLYKNK